MEVFLLESICIVVSQTVLQICCKTTVYVFPGSPITSFYGLVSEPPFSSVKVYHHPKGTTILLMVVDFQGFRNTSHSHI